MTSADDRRLPIARQASPDGGACCGACVAGPEDAAATTPPTPSTALPTVRPRIDRDADRRITGLSIGLGALFVGAGLLAATIGALSGGSAWMPLHLVLAGAAGTVIAGVLPFFTAALAVAPPADARARLAAVGCIVVGAIVVIAAIRGGSSVLGAVGGSVYLVGLALVAVVASRPLRRALGPRRRAIERAYIGALGMIVGGVLLATAMLAGWDPVVERWSMLKPAHVWLNLVGSLSLIVLATLTHLAPTIEGTTDPPSRRLASRAGRHRRRRRWRGPRLRPRVRRAGACRRRVRVDRCGRGPAPCARGPLDGQSVDDRRRLASVHGLEPPRRQCVVRRSGMAVMAGRVLWLGADPAAWSLPLAGIPLVIGWVLQVMVGSWSHLIPALGPGDPVARAVRRDLLGRAAAARLAAFNAGVLLAWIGIAAGLPALTLVGASSLGLAVAASLGLAAAAAHGRPGLAGAY